MAIPTLRPNDEAPPWIWTSAGIGIGILIGALGVVAIYSLGKLL